MNLLYVEDDKQLSLILNHKLSYWFQVDLATDCKSALAKADEVEYDLIILDYYLPDGIGIDLCRQIRISNSFSLILMLTQDKSKKSVIESLESGADDYLTKPFNFDELRARLQAMLRRRTNQIQSQILTCGEYTLNQSNFKVYFKDKRIPLKRREFLLLEYLWLHKGMVVSKTRMYEHVWNQELYVSNTVEVHIKRLRNKIEIPFNRQILETVYGVGYRLLKEPKNLSGPEVYLSTVSDFPVD